MAFKDFPNQEQVVTLLQRSLERGRLGHAYLFIGLELGVLETMARTLAKTLNCQNPPHRGATGLATDCCDHCLTCRKINEDLHADIHWIRPESKMRQISVDQIRELMGTVNLKPTEAEFKVSVLVAADRLNVSAANAFLKTLEEPPANSILILLSTEPQRLLETILSRCLRLTFAAGSAVQTDAKTLTWLGQFVAEAAQGNRSLLGRYKLLALLVQRLGEMKAEIQETLTARSPIQKYEEAEPGLVEKWERELSAAVESEYRRQRMELLAVFEWWMRDVWLLTLGAAEGLFTFPQFSSQSEIVAKRIQAREALENLDEIERTQRLLHTNVQEALALEVGLLKLKL
ncbi:MAG: DNA polymerase III subunit [Verrucomicrobiota bacterium]